MDRWEDALEAVNKSLELNPRSSTWWHFKAFILTELDRKEEALAAFNEAIGQNPEDIGNCSGRPAFVEMKRYNESLEAYDKAIELAAENNTEELARPGSPKHQP